MPERYDRPAVRVRAHHDFTVKDGWRCDETTVEITSPFNSHAHAVWVRDWLKILMEAVYEEARTEAARRNESEGRGSLG